MDKEIQGEDERECRERHSWARHHVTTDDDREHPQDKTRRPTPKDPSRNAKKSLDTPDAIKSTPTAIAMAIPAAMPNPACRLIVPSTS